MHQINIFELLEEKPKLKSNNEFELHRFVFITKINGYTIRFRDFMNYHIQLTDKLKDITDADIFKEVNGRYIDFVGFDYSTICIKQYGYYLRHLNEFDYTKRDETFNVIIQRLGLKISLAELLELTIGEFEQLIKG